VHHRYSNGNSSRRHASPRTNITSDAGAVTPIVVAHRKCNRRQWPCTGHRTWACRVTVAMPAPSRIGIGVWQPRRLHRHQQRVSPSPSEAAASLSHIDMSCHFRHCQQCPVSAPAQGASTSSSRPGSRITVATAGSASPSLGVNITVSKIGTAAATFAACATAAVSRNASIRPRALRIRIALKEGAADCAVSMGRACGDQRHRWLLTRSPHAAQTRRHVARSLAAPQN